MKKQSWFWAWSGAGVLVVSGVLLSSCVEKVPPPLGAAPILSGNFVTLKPENLDSLPSSQVYELWLLRSTPHGTEQKSLGKFRWDKFLYAARHPDGSRITENKFDAGEDVFAWAEIAITIEQANDPSPAPSASVFFLGTINDTLPDLRLTYPINLTKEEFKGDFFLASPTDSAGFEFLYTDFTTPPLADRQRRESQGIWFGDLALAKEAKRDTAQFVGVTPGLVLPKLSAGWQYEGWVLVGGKYLSTGKFLRADSADFTNPYLGPKATGKQTFTSGDSLRFTTDFKIPGEDFILNPPSGFVFPLSMIRTPASGDSVFVTIEPSPDPSPATPFRSLTLYGAQLPTALSSSFIHQNLGLANISRRAPAVAVSISDK